MFKNLPQRFFENDEEVNLWLKEFELENNINCPEDWYNISSCQIISKNKGSSLYGKYFGSSMINIMKKLYPDFDWLEWLNENGVSNKYWQNKENIIKYMAWLKNILNYNDDDDWYNLTGRIVIQNKGGGMFDIYGNNIYNLICDVFPDKIWDKNMFIRNNTEKKYGKFINSLNAEHQIILDAQYCINNCKNIRALKFDFGNDNRKDIHEVDGQQHFINVEKWKSEYVEIQERDVKKMIDAINAGKVIIRIYQMDIYYDKFKWREIIIRILDNLENDDTQVYFISKDCLLYNNHINLLLKNCPGIKYKKINE